MKDNFKDIIKFDETLLKEVWGNKENKIWEKEVGSIDNKGNSVEQVRKAREKLSKEKIDLDLINQFDNSLAEVKARKIKRVA